MKYFVAEAPSNIAFLKYWGKKNERHQWPANNSISMTLNGLTTQTEAIVTSSSEHSFYFSGEYLSKDNSFAKKAYKQLELIRKELAKSEFLQVKSQNNFPAACGIASSASSMAALTIAAVGAYLNCNSFEELSLHGYGKESLAHLARLGSGSAGRSLWGGFVAWEKGLEANSQKIFQAYPTQHWQLSDHVVLFSNKAKSISSTDGHRMAWTSPFFKTRLADINKRYEQFNEYIETRDINQFGSLLEQEALEVHAIMSSSSPSVVYIDEDVGNFLAWVRSIRQNKRLACYFTLDAGPNVHVITPKEESSRFLDAFSEQWPQHKILIDEVGKGPTLCTRS